MQGKIKKLKDNSNNYAYPITVAEAVYVETNKTLKQAMADGTLGGSGGTTEVTVSGRGYALVSLRGSRVDVKKNTDDNTCKYSFPTLDSNRYRRLFVWTASGAKKWIDIPDGTLLDNDALVYNVSINTLSTKNGTWGNITVSADELLLLYNNLGNISGILSSYCVMGGDSTGIPIREIEAELISNTGSTQGVFIVGDNIYKCSHSADDHSDFVNITVVSKTTPNTALKTISHNLGHMNAPSYNVVKDSLLVGNGSKSYSLLPKGWILPNFSTLTQGTTIDFNTVDKIELDFSQFTGEYKGQLCWGYHSTDIVYLFTNDNRVLRKIQLGKGVTDLGSGTFITGTADTRYNGSYSVLNTWQSRTADILGGMMFYKGYIYTGVKGEHGIRKCIPLSNGYFDSEYIGVLGKGGDMQGLDISDNFVYAFTDGKGTKFPVNEL